MHYFNSLHYLHEIDILYSFYLSPKLQIVVESLKNIHRAILLVNALISFCWISVNVCWIATLFLVSEKTWKKVFAWIYENQHVQLSLSVIYNLLMTYHLFDIMPSKNHVVQQTVKFQILFLMRKSVCIVFLCIITIT